MQNGSGKMGKLAAFFYAITGVIILMIYFPIASFVFDIGFDIASGMGGETAATAGFISFFFYKVIPVAILLVFGGGCLIEVMREEDNSRVY
jgi:hypothetical protein